MRFFYFSITIFVISCVNENAIKNIDELKTDVQFLEINFDSNLVSHYLIEDEEYGLSKAITIPLSTYSTKDLEELPNSKRLTLWITVPYDISKVSLSNTLKSIII